MPAARKVPRPFALHWGSGQIVEEASSAGQHDEPAIQLLEMEDAVPAGRQGSLEVRFCYYDHEGPFDYTQGRRFQRSPLIVSNDELSGLRRALAGTPRLRALLREMVG